MGLLARASREDLASGLAGLADIPAFDEVRAPEIGLVMLRGRIAATGAPFNLGEATVARASVRLATGEVGFGYSLGRDLAKARLAALADALWAHPDRRSELEAQAPGAAAEQARRAGSGGGRAHGRDTGGVLHHGAGRGSGIVSAPGLHRGFEEPGFDAQAVFRTLMGAMARPGTLARIGPRPARPALLPPGIAALALTLLDYDTPTWIDAALADAPEVAGFLRFQTGAPLTTDPAAAAFALVGNPLRLPPLDRFALGTADYPDRSTTLFIDVEALDDTSGWRLSGPGIEDCARLAVTPLPDGFAEQRRALEPLFPRGLDVVFVAGELIAALPRSTRLEV